MIRFAHTGDIGQIRELWKLCFDDPDEFLAFYFNCLFDSGQTLVYEIEDVLVASMQIIPHTLKIDSKLVKAGYVFGAMTHPGHRRHGYMAKLLHASFGFMQKQGMQASFLIPQEDWLFDFYEAYGYTRAFPRSMEKLRIDSRLRGRKRAFILPDQLEADSTYSLLLNDLPKVVCKTALQAKILLDEFVLSGGKIFICSGGMALAFNLGRKVYVKELLAGDEESERALLTEISAYYQQPDLRLYRYQEQKDAVFYGMLKPLNEDLTLPSDLYMSMMFD